MKDFKIVLTIIVALVLLNTSLVGAMAQAEVEKEQLSLGYGIQVLDSDIKALNLESSYGFSPNFGLDTLYTYKDSDVHYLDFNFKMNLVEDPNYDVSALLGYHTEYSNSDFHNDAPRIGVIYSRPESEYLDFNFGLDFLLKEEDNYVGYTFGFDYKLTRSLYLEVAHSKISGQEGTEGLSISLRHYFE